VVVASALVDGRARERATDFVYSMVRQSILHLDLPPGATIDKNALCERFGVSRSPVSEALARLSADGLVEIFPQRGTRVARIRITDIREAMFIRRALEVETVRTLSTNISEETLSKLSLNLEYQSIAAKNEQAKEFHELDLAFHDILVGEIGYPRVKDVIDVARNSLERARRILLSPVGHPNIIREHEAILTALKNRDTLAATAAMERHLETTLHGFLALARESKQVIAA